MAIVLGPKYDSCVFDIWCTHSHLYVDKLDELIPNVHSVKTNNKTKQNLLKYFNFNVFPQGWCYYYLFSRKNWDKVLYCLLEYGTGRIKTHPDRFEGPNVKSHWCYSTKPGWNGVAEERAVLMTRESLKVEYLLSLWLLFLLMFLFKYYF